MKIGELARRAGCQVVTVRYYEKEGLLGAPERTRGNYRIYTEADLARLRFIRQCRICGIKVAEIRRLLAFSDRPDRSCAWINSLICEHIENVRRQIADLEHLESHLLALQQKCDGDKGGDCGILDCLRNPESCRVCAQAKPV